MTNKAYIDRIVNATGLKPEDASKALFAVFQGFLDTIGEKSSTSFNVSPGPDSGSQANTNITVVINIVVPPPPLSR